MAATFDDAEFAAGVFGIGQPESEAAALDPDVGPDAADQSPDVTPDNESPFAWLEELGKEQTTEGAQKDAPVADQSAPASPSGDIPAAPVPQGVTLLGGITPAEIERSVRLGVPAKDFQSWNPAEVKGKLDVIELYLQHQAAFQQQTIQQQEAARAAVPVVFDEAAAAKKYEDFEPGLAANLIAGDRTRFELEQTRREMEQLRGYVQQQAVAQQQANAAQMFNTWNNNIANAVRANEHIAPYANDPAAIYAIQQESYRIATAMSQAGQAIPDDPAVLAKRAAFALYGEEILKSAQSAKPAPQQMTRQQFVAGATPRPRPSNPSKMAGGREQAIAEVMKLPAFAKLQGLSNN